MSRFWVIIPALVLFGCGRPPEPKVVVDPPPQEKPSPEPPPKPAAKPIIYSARELAKVLDLGALPVIEGSKFGEKRSSRLEGNVPAPVKEVVAFYTAKLSALGWTPFETADKVTDELGSVNFAKDGHLAHLTAISVGKDGTILSIVFYGNFDATTLPRREGSERLYASPTLANYFTVHPIEEEAAWLKSQLAADGWQEFGPMRPTTKTVDAAHLAFRKQGYALKAYITDSIDPKTREKKTSTQLSITALSHELPAPPNATDICFDDARWEMRCDAPGKVDTVGAWYQKAMPEVGYVALPSEDAKAKSWTLRFGTDAGDIVRVSLSLATDASTHVNIEGVPKAVLDKLKSKS